MARDSRARKQVEEGRVLVVAAGRLGHEHHVHIAAIGYLTQLKRKLLFREDPAPVLCGFPHHVPFRDGQGQLDIGLTPARERHSDVLGRTRVKGTDDALVKHAGGDVPKPRVLVGRYRRILQEVVPLEGLDLGLGWLSIIGHGRGRSLRRLSHVYTTTVGVAFVPCPAGSGDERGRRPHRAA